MTMSADGRRRFELRGVVSSVGFESGLRDRPLALVADRRVHGSDVGGSRRHASPPSAVGSRAFVRPGIYAFDNAAVAPVVATVTTSSVEVHAGDVGVDLSGGLALPIPFSSIPRVTRWVHDPIARVTMGVRTYGKSPTGVREWYRAQTYRRVLTASGSVDGRDLGPLAPRIDPPVRFGFSEPPRRPSMVWLRPLLEHRNGDGHPG